MGSLFLLLAFAVAEEPRAAELVVDPAGLASPYRSIQSAIDAALDGDDIVVRPGVFREAPNFLGKSISVSSVGGAGTTSIELGCGVLDHVRMVDVEDGILAGFTVRSGCDDGPGGPYLLFQGTGLLEGLVFGGASGLTAGIGLSAIGGPIRARNIVYLGSPSGGSLLDFAGTVFLAEASGSVSLQRVVVVGRTHYNFLDVRAYDHVSINNFLHLGHFTGTALLVTGEDGTLLPPGDVSIRNSTIVLSPDPGWGASAVVQTWPTEYSLPSISSSVLVNSQGPVLAASPNSPDYAVSHSNLVPGASSEVVATWPAPGPFDTSITSPVGSNGVISEDPGFVAYSDDWDWTNDDLCPGPGSPLIDAGDPDPAQNDPDGTRNDMGAFGGPDAFTCEEVLDQDGDGWMPLMGDCDDLDPGRTPFLEEVACDGIDQDCDGEDLLDGCGDDDDSSAGDDDDSSAGDDDDSSLADDDDSGGTDDDDDAADEPATCGCGSGPRAGLLPLLFLGPALRRRRVR